MVSNKLPVELEQKIKAELATLNRSYIEVNGRLMTPDSCYYFDAHPPHVLYNTNCPEGLKKRIKEIISKYIPEDESNAH